MKSSRFKDYINNKRPKFKAQSAMEYLTTYGWAILLIAIILIAFFDLGVFGNGNATSTTCLAEVGFSCSNPLLNSTGNFSVELGNSFSYPLNITGIGCSNSTSAPSTFTPFLTQIFSNGQSNLTYQCTMQSNNIGASFAGTLWIQYNNNQVAQVATISGKATTAGSIGNNGQGVFYLTNQNGGTTGYGNIIEINGQSGNVINAIDFQIQNNYFDFPTGIAISGQNAYIVNQYSNNVIIFDTTTSQTSQLPSTSFAGPSGIAVFDSNVYITNQYSNNIIIYDTLTRQTSQLPSTSFDRPTGIAFLDSNAYITNSGSNNVIIYNTQIQQISQLPSTSLIIQQESHS